MKINIRNVGSIKNFDFEFKKGLTIFCGPNNTGKTYAAYTIYSILNGFTRCSPDWVTPTEFRSLIEKGSISVDPLRQDNSKKFYAQIDKALKEGLESDFDAPSGFFAKCSLDIELPKSFISSRSAIKKPQMRVGTFEVEYFFENDNLTVVLAKKTDAEQSEDVPLEIFRTFLNRVISQLYAEQFLNRAFVLTAERSAINLFSRELSSSRNALVDQLLSLNNSDKRKGMHYISDFVGARAKRYSLPIRDGLEIAEDLKTISKGKGELASLAVRLEKEVIGGEIAISDSGDIVYHPSKSHGLRINLAASLVKSLSSLIVYLRYQSKVGDLLIIDEPEMNLHPDNQRRIARFFCELVNSGVDVLMSTHSDYIIREINNSIVLKQESMVAVREKHGYSDLETLSSNDVSVVLFKSDGTPVHVDVGDLGFSVESIDDEINALNMISEDILVELSK
jgi:predicted ATP-dependent endonuclease of OLD family